MMKQDRQTDRQTGREREREREGGGGGGLDGSGRHKCKRVKTGGTGTYTIVTANKYI